MIKYCVTLAHFQIIFWKPPKLIIRESGQGHSWFGTDFIDKPTYCNHCKELFVTVSTWKLANALKPSLNE